MKNRTVLILASVLLGLAVLIVLVVAFIAITGTSSTENPNDTQLLPTEGLFPSSFTTTESTTLSTGEGELQVNDFIHNGETVSDPVNPGNYVLAGDLGYCLADGTCPQGASSDRFSISYDSQKQFFTVVLLKEPLNESRLAAETFLIERLGVSRESLCLLNAYVGVPYWINDRFADGTVGFSACPQSVRLP
ncbi:hypothetical protein KJ819_02700 [Patescibacteria group bacterium]|nr:hypothetical protein [Patescibacteria group bacterium]MBU1500810.1 hypothetical protein [Patescibacteria group bacterium]MBU2080865.1 hypothetical protein [Patescibacteria group bacterium]MBU2123970.1 hypothetical protein [Patescibacteria group bacterium]MBU2194739.1 hypothetical protein [Patescibacteria group bacterium]